MTPLPQHGRSACRACYFGEQGEFDRTRREDGEWRITENPLAWGGREPIVIVLGFSKGPSQVGALSRLRHEEIAFSGARLNVGRILAHVGLLEPGEPRHQQRQVDRLIADPSGSFHFGSLIRCTVERRDPSKGWVGTGGDMLGGFMSSRFGNEVAKRCASNTLGDVPSSVRVAILFGLGKQQSYVQQARKLISAARGTSMKAINEVAYADDKLVVVHVEHFRSQGALIPQWMGEREYVMHPRSRFGRMAREAVEYSLTR